MTVLLCLLIESILYFWLLFLAIDMFEVNDMTVGLASDRNLLKSGWLLSVEREPLLWRQPFLKALWFIVNKFYRWAGAVRSVYVLSACFEIWGFRWKSQFRENNCVECFKNLIETKLFSLISIWPEFHFPSSSLLLLSDRLHTYSTVINAITEAHHQLIQPLAC